MAEPMRIFRQGDVGFIPRTDLPKSISDVESLIGRDKKTKAKLLKTRTIRKGEHGGIHALAEDAKTKGVVYYELDGVRYVIGSEGVGIVHGEHKRLDLPPGAYEIRVQREADGRSWRNVRD